MKIIKNGIVYDIGYGHYETVCELPFGWNRNEVGNFQKATKELRKDKDSGRYYVLTSSSDWDRASTVLCPCTKEAAMSLAEDYLEYAQFAEYFGDPEGELSEAKRRACDAEERASSLARDKDYWYKEWSKLNDKAKGEPADPKAGA